jgi:predicted regulator of Ras-like GTPase activity (Roadblock/LC7/MglB family)
MVKKRKVTQEVATLSEPLAVEETACEDYLRTSLEEVKKMDGIIGYILRNSTSASIDLKDPARIIDYATLSSSACDASEDFSDIFDLGNVDTIIVEGKNAKMLSLTIDENRISVFMQRNASHEKVLKKIRKS